MSGLGFDPNHHIAGGNRAAVTALALVLALPVLTQGCSGNPSRDDELVPSLNVGIHDFYTLRSQPDGSLGSRDIAPIEQPREAIRGDDYFGFKLEHIFIGDALGRDIGNLAIVTEIEGLLPDHVRCEEMDPADVGVDLAQRDRTGNASQRCSLKHVVSINPVFRDGHVTFDSAYISPVFRLGREPVTLRFLMAQINDYELARQILGWAETALDELEGMGIVNLGEWQRKLVNIGVTAANWIIDYASRDDFVFELDTDFVPIESVEGAVPQNLLVEGDFVIVGFAQGGPEGALLAQESLIFDSGRLYWRDTRAEYRDAPYVVYRVMRHSRMPQASPFELADFSRSVQRGRDAQSLRQDWRSAVFELQDARILNDTEGGYILDMLEWFADAYELWARLDESIEVSAGDRPAALDGLPVDLEEAARVIHLRAIAQTFDDLEHFYQRYGQTPGMTQSECVHIERLVDDLSRSFEEIEPDARITFGELQVRRNEAQMAGESGDELEALTAAERWLARQWNEVPDRLDIVRCPAIRLPYQARR